MWITISSNIEIEDIPEKYRDFEDVGINGEHLFAYWTVVNQYDNEDITFCDIADYLIKYLPSWETVSDFINEKYFENPNVWKKEQHNELIDAFNYFKSRDDNAEIIFTV